jgi:lysophospholipase L1-like esterase
LKSPFIAKLNNHQNQTIVAYGTSLTEGGSWVKELADALEKKFPGLATMINSGGSGQWSRWGVANLEERVISKKPDVVFIEFAVNDSVARFNGSVEEARQNLNTIIDRILASNPQCEIILMTMTPADKHPLGHFSYRLNIVDYYEMYRQEAKKHQLLLIDHAPNWLALQASDKALFDNLVPDSIHPTAEGNAKIVTPQILKLLGLS